MREAVEDFVFGLGELLDDVVDAGVAGGESEVLFQPAISDGGDAGRRGGAEIDRDAVGFAVSDGGEDAFARSHVGWIVEWN